MAKYIRAVSLAEDELVTLDAIATVKRFDGGVGLLDLRDRMLGWIEIDPDADEATRERLFRRTLQIFAELINNRRRAMQPDWSFLTEHLQPQPSAKPNPASATAAK